MSVLVVIALYMITVISKQRVGTNDIDRVAAPADIRSAAVIDEVESIPIGERFAPTVDSLRAVIAAGAGQDAYSTRRELVAYLIDIGRVDRAAIEQQRLAREIGQVNDWRRAGDLLYDWMESVNVERKTDVALLTIDAYERVLEEAPDDLDVRADLGWAYQYDPQNPMEAIQHTNQVLEQEPDHLAANYNRGVFLLRINRIEEAVMQFERVVELADEGSLYTRQARAWIRTIQEQQSAQP
jgi:tetratricopeptide (TPR) repeat protein